jgi:hypothetical protein
MNTVKPKIDLRKFGMPVDSKTRLFLRQSGPFARSFPRLHPRSAPAVSADTTS